MQPAFHIIADGQDITKTIRTYIKDLRLSDKTGLQADQLSITLDDSDARIALPRRGVELRLWLGDSPQSLVDKGSFIVDGCPLSGPPDTMTIEASSANFRDGLKSERDLDYDFVSIGHIIEEIADRNALIAAVEDNLSIISIEHKDQTNESDINLVTRLAKEHDALATVKNGHLLFVPIGYTKSLSGVDFPILYIDRSETDRFSYDLGDRDSRYTGVAAKYQSINTGRTRKVLVGGEGYVRTLKEQFPNEDEARSNANAEWKKLQRGSVTMSLSLAKGRMQIAPNHKVVLTGFRDEINQTSWITGDIDHSLGDNGLTTEVKLESALEG